MGAVRPMPSVAPGSQSRNTRFHLCREQALVHRLCVVGMHLDREAIASEDIFDQQGHIRPVGAFEPDFADLSARTSGREDRRKVGPGPWFFDIMGNKL